MAAVLGVVSGAVSLAGFAGQLAQGTLFLCGFFKDIKDAPEDVRRLLEELTLLERLFGGIQRSFSGHDPDLEQALRFCEQKIGELSTFVKLHEPAVGMKKGEVFWKKLKLASRQSELVKYLGGLERAKSMVLQACMSISRYENLLDRLFLA